MTTTFSRPIHATFLAGFVAAFGVASSAAAGPYNHVVALGDSLVTRWTTDQPSIPEFIADRLDAPLTTISNPFPSASLLDASVQVAADYGPGDLAVVWTGGHDLDAMAPEILLGDFSGLDDLEANVDTILGNLRGGGLDVVFFNFFDLATIPKAMNAYPSEVWPIGTAAAREWRTRAVALATEHGAAVVDVFSLSQLLPHGLGLAEVSLVPGPQSGPRETCALCFWHDSVHPTPVGRGFIANEAIATINRFFGLNGSDALPLLTQAELLALAGSIPNMWTATGPPGGNVLAFAANPVDSTVMYAGAAEGGVFRTSSSGSSWSYIGLAPRFVYSIVIDPADPTVLYAGTDRGVHRSVNSGNSWEPATLFEQSVYRLLIDPDSPDTLYAGTSDGIYKSLDGATSWFDVSDDLAQSPLPFSGGSVRSIVFDPASSQTLYAAAGPNVFKTIDGAASWLPVIEGTSESDSISDLAIDPVAPGVLYVSSFGSGIMKTTDGGEIWVAVNTGLSSLVVRGLLIDPTSHETVYAATDSGVFKTSDAGASWALVHQVADFTSTLLAFDSASSVLYLGGSGIFTSTDRGANWARAENGFFATRLHALALDPSIPTILYAGTDAGAWKSTDGASTWSNLPLGGEILDVAVDPSEPTSVYASAGRYIFKSTNGGATWSSAGSFLFPGFVRSIAIDSGGVVYAASGGGVFRSDDAGDSWTSVSNGLTNLVTWSIAIDPTTPETLYVATGSGVFTSTDSGANWAPTSLSGETRFVAVHPEDPEIVFASVETVVGLHVSSDGGATWTLRNLHPFQFSGLFKQFRSMAFNPANPNEIFAATEANGVYRSTDGGTSWGSLQPGAYNRNVNEVILAPGAPPTIYAGTSGGGVFQVQITCGDGILAPDEQCDDGNSLSFDCCSALCLLDTADSPCHNDGESCTEDTCDGAGTCLHEAGNAGAMCRVPNGVCDVAEVCDGISASCPADTEFREAGVSCPPDDDPCTPDICDGFGQCIHADQDMDGIGDLCDSCPDVGNPGQENSDCDDPDFRSSGGCLVDPTQHPGCCDGGDACDPCPANADNAACNPEGSAVATVGTDGRDFTSPDGLLAITVPPGAVAQDTSVSLTRTALATAAGDFALGSVGAISARPPGQQFAAPIEVTVGWLDRDNDGKVDTGLCEGGAHDTASCDADDDCPAGTCSVSVSNIREENLVLERNAFPFGRNGFAPDYRCSDHEAGSGCESVVANCNDAPGSGTATVAKCCDATNNTWAFQTCSFSEFTLGVGPFLDSERVDAYLTYKAKAARQGDGSHRFPRDWNLQLRDHAVPMGVDNPENYVVKKESGVANPGTVNAAISPDDPALHYLLYQVKEAKEGLGAPLSNGRLPKPVRAPERVWELNNAFGTVVVQSKKVTRLWVPSGQSLDQPSPDDPGDRTHYLCYQVTPRKGIIAGQSPGTCDRRAIVNAKGPCQAELDCGGTPGITRFCAKPKFRKTLQAFATDEFADCATYKDTTTVPFANTSAQAKCLFDLKAPRELCNPVETSAVPSGYASVAMISASTPSTDTSLLCYQMKTASAFEHPESASLAEASIGSKLPGRQAKHARRSRREGTSVYTTPSSQLPAPTELETKTQELLCVPTEVLAVRQKGS